MSADFPNGRRLSNAPNFTHRGTVAINVTVRVADSGIGIAGATPQK